MPVELYFFLWKGLHVLINRFRNPKLIAGDFAVNPSSETQGYFFQPLVPRTVEACSRSRDSTLCWLVDPLSSIHWEFYTKEMQLGQSILDFRNKTRFLGVFFSGARNERGMKQYPWVAEVVVNQAKSHIKKLLLMRVSLLISTILCLHVLTTKASHPNCFISALNWRKIWHFSSHTVFASRVVIISLPWMLLAKELSPGLTLFGLGTASSWKSLSINLHSRASWACVKHDSELLVDVNRRRAHCLISITVEINFRKSPQCFSDRWWYRHDTKYNG